MPDSSTKHIKALSLTNSLSLQRQVSWKTKTIPEQYFVLLFFLTSHSLLLHCNLSYTTLLKMLLQRLPMNTWASCCSSEQGWWLWGWGRGEAQQRRGCGGGGRGYMGDKWGKNKFNGYTSPFIFPKLCGALDLTLLESLFLSGFYDTTPPLLSSLPTWLFFRCTLLQFIS